MNSSDLNSIGLSSWMRFNRASEAECVERAPRTEGVYAIRRNAPFDRRRGASDILYIGCAANRVGGLQTRCRQYFHPGYGNATSKRILARCGDCDDYEIAFVVDDRPKALESDLLARYEGDHGELPPENRRR